MRLKSGPFSGAPGPPQDTLNTALTGHHLDHAQEVRALAILAMVVFGFLALVAILYAIRWMCLLTNNKVHTVSFVWTPWRAIQRQDTKVL
ncbi:hypothetical protein ANCCAN_28136 [Ancylostoma caninum]|uniref:Uncharacterized protein n=1 Tax=Ancylostoma caninum TaxID=29170 RepID=A0A368F231_ANCCA|nr:hypothetical protein ANCCAN_28136 [Ancylostoma caninum]